MFAVSTLSGSKAEQYAQLLEQARGLMHGDVAWSDVGWVLLAAAVVLTLTAPVAMRLYNKER